MGPAAQKRGFARGSYFGSACLLASYSVKAWFCSRKLFWKRLTVSELRRGTLLAAVNLIRENLFSFRKNLSARGKLCASKWQFARELSCHSKHNKCEVSHKLGPAAQKRGFARGSYCGSACLLASYSVKAWFCLRKVILTKRSSEDGRFRVLIRLFFAIGLDFWGRVCYTDNATRAS